MKKVFLFAGFILLNSYLFSQDSCVIKLNLGDCRFCYGPLSKLNETTDVLKKTVLTLLMDSAIVSTFLKDEIGVNFTYDLIASDSGYNAINTNQQSEIVFYDNKNIVYKSLLKQFNGDLVLKPSFTEQTTEIPDSLKISRRLSLKFIDNKFLLLDKVTTNVIVYDILKNRICKRLKINSVKPESYFNLFNVDSVSRSFYEQNKATLNAYGVTHLRPFGDDFCTLKNHLFINVLLSFPKYVDSIRTIVIDQEPLLLISSLDRDSIIPVPCNEIAEKVLPDYKLQVCGGPFVFSKDSIFFIFSSSALPDKLIIAKFKYDDDLKYSEYFTIPFPKYYKQHAVENYELISWKFSFPYLVSVKSNEVYDINTKKCWFLPVKFDQINEKDDILKMEYTNFILDVYSFGNKLLILNQRKSKNRINHYYNLFETPLMKLMNCNEINLSNDYRVQDFNFINNHSLIGFDSNNKIVTFNLPDGR